MSRCRRQQKKGSTCLDFQKLNKYRQIEAKIIFRSIYGKKGH